MPNLIFHEFDQQTDEWYQAKLGKFGSSNGQAVSANGKGLETLVFEKVAEIITGKSKDSYTNPDLERGIETENTARADYELTTGNRVRTVGLVQLDEYTVCSPDGLVGDDGIIEIKCPNDANFVRYLFDRNPNSAYVWQMQFQMFVTGRRWVDFCNYNVNFPESLIIDRIERDDKAIERIKIGLENGIGLINKILEQVK